MSGFRGNKKGKSAHSKGNHAPRNNRRGVAKDDEDFDAGKGNYTGEAEEDLLSGSGSENEADLARRELSVRVALWEFGQNDPKRDSGSKLFRLGYAQRLKVGQTFSGIVLSSEATSFLSPADADIIKQHGVAGINCSWNRLEEIPFAAMGKSRHQRKLPLIVAANTVNYGKPFKMNTAEALAAALYVAGFVEDARTLMYPFSYGQEFLRLNAEAFELYRQCHNEVDIQLVMNNFMSNMEEHKEKKEKKKEVERKERIENANIGGYMDEMDLPPMQSDEDDEEEYEEIEADSNPNHNHKNSNSNTTSDEPSNSFNLKELSDVLK